MHDHDDAHLTPTQLADVRRRGDAELRNLGFSRRSILRAGAAAAAVSAVGAPQLVTHRTAFADGATPVDPEKLQ